jgi:hypothetical protein
MPTIASAVIGLLAVIGAVFLTARTTQKVESRKQTAKLAAEAFIDMMNSFAGNSEANGVLKRTSQEPMFQTLSEAQRAEFIARLADSRVRSISAKNRLMAFGSVRVAEAAHAALGRGDVDLGDPATQRALCELIQRIREDIHPDKTRLDDQQILDMFFGPGAISLEKTLD